MHNETPAAFPLIALITGLAIGPVLVNPRVTAVAVFAIALLWRRTAVAFIALGIALTLFAPKPPALDPETFTVIEVPLHRDWQARDDGSFVLKAPDFRANGEHVDAPISIYTRFPPPEVVLHERIKAEGFLRQNERGEYTLSIKSPVLLSYEGELAWWSPKTWNRMLANRLERSADQHPNEVALAQALLLGRGERLSGEVRDSFRGGGTYHLLVFSGLQIALAAGLLGALLRWLHAPRASDWLLLTFSIVAPLFIGPTASVSRASLGIGLYALARILKRPTSLENLWCVAALLRLVIEPRDLTDASFHLTYAGAGALLFLGKRWITRPLTIEIAIAPLTLFHFHQYALGGSLLTIAMSPLIFAMLVASALACVHPAAFAAIASLHRVCSTLNGFGFAGAFAAPPPASLVLGSFAALLALASLRDRVTRALAISIAMFIPIASAVVRSMSQRDVEHPTVTVFDVGQADAIAVRSKEKTILVDTGADARIVPLLADRGVRRIDVAVLTHAHPDHCGGLVPLLQQLDVREVWVTPHRFRGDCATRLLAASPPIHLVRDGETRVIGDIRLTAFTAGTLRQAPENNASIVLRVETGGRRVLLTGDIEAEAEIVLTEGRDLRADLLKVAHHGSRTSTTDRFLDAVQPRLAVISCGRRNLFGHPHPRVLESLAERNVRAWRTDVSGSIDVEIRDRRFYVLTRKELE